MTFTPKNRAEWRTWLSDNHSTATDVWLVFFKKSSGKTNLSYNDAVEEALCFGWIDGIKRSIDDERYCHRFSPRKPDSNWSPSNKYRVEKLIQSGLMMPAGQKAIDEAKNNGAWEKSSSNTPSTDMPPEFKQRLESNKAAAHTFDGLAPSHQKQYLMWINAAKRQDTRERRMDESIELLNQGKKLGMR